MQMQVIFFIFLFFSTHSLSCESLKMDVKAESAILINGKTGRILFAKNASKEQFPASTTKVATAIFAIERGQGILDQKFVASLDAIRTVSPAEKRRDNYGKYPSHWLESDASHVGIKLGEEIPFRDLLYGLMLASGDDAANVIAEHFGNGSVVHFTQEMNEKLRSIGCTHTHFCNPHGLHHPEHVTTAKDMAVLCQYAMKNELFRKIVRTLSYERQATNKQPKTTYLQGNKLIRKGQFYYPLAVGIKTGWHSKGLSSLVAAAEKDGRLLIAVLLRNEERADMFRDVKTLFEKAFSQKKIEKTLLNAGMQSFERGIEGAEKPVCTYTKEALRVSYYPAEEPAYRCHLIWDKVKLPIDAGQKVGEIQLFADQDLMHTIPLYAQGRVERSFLGQVLFEITHIVSSPISLIALIGVFALLLYSVYVTSSPNQK